MKGREEKVLFSFFLFFLRGRGEGRGESRGLDGGRRRRRRPDERSPAPKRLEGEGIRRRKK